MTFQVGNQYAVSRRTIENALRRVVHSEPERLRRALHRVLVDAAEHDSPAHRLACVQFLADRLDGKARQSIEVTGDQPRELSLADVVQAVLAARASTATDLPALESSATDATEVSACNQASRVPALSPEPASRE